MAIILKPFDFHQDNARATLVKILHAHESGENIYSKNVVPPGFQIVAETKGVKLAVSSPMTEIQPATWLVVPSLTRVWDFEFGDEVRDKSFHLLFVIQ